MEDNRPFIDSKVDTRQQVLKMTPVATAGGRDKVALVVSASQMRNGIFTKARDSRFSLMAAFTLLKLVVRSIV